MKTRNNKGFTLIELLVVIAIIGILSTLAIVALGSARQKARDSKRVSDINQISKALEMYYGDANAYPTLITTGQALSYGGTTYLSAVPTNPSPKNDVNCPNADYVYAPSSSTAVGYTLNFCLGSATGSLSSGLNYASAGGLNGDPSLVGWWKLNEGTGTSVADSSSTRNTNTLTNFNYNSTSGWAGGSITPTVSPTGAGASLLFDGTNDYIDAGSNTALRPNYVSVAAWVYYMGDDGAIVGQKDTGSAVEGYALAISGGNLVFWIYGTTGNATGGNGGTLPTGQWSHVVATYDGLIRNIYVNGVLTTVGGIGPGRGPVVYTNQPVRIGQTDGAGYLQAGLSDVRIYNRSLSPSEIVAIYNAGH